MMWCNILNMWCKDIDDEDDAIGWDGDCGNCDEMERVLRTVRREDFERRKLQSKRRLVGSNRNEFLDLPYLVIECAVLPQYKGDKKTCSGYYVDPLDPNKSFSFAGATIDVQAVAAMKKAAGGE